MNELSEVKSVEEPSKKQKAWAITKKLSKRWFIDAFTGMAQGLFVTLIAGTIIKTLGSNVINEIFGANSFGNFLILLGQVASVLMGAGIGAGIAYFLKTNKLVTFACIVAGSKVFVLGKRRCAQFPYARIYFYRCNHGL